MPERSQGTRSYHIAPLASAWAALSYDAANPLLIGPPSADDWAGSSSGDTRDTKYFNQIFDEVRSDGKTLFGAWAAEDSAEKREKLIDEVHAILNETRWLSSYRGAIKAQIREACQGGAKVWKRPGYLSLGMHYPLCAGDAVQQAILVRIEGGPITRVEARIMPLLIDEARADLAALGITKPDIELHAFDTIFDLQKRLPDFCKQMQIYDY